MLGVINRHYYTCCRDGKYEQNKKPRLGAVSYILPNICNTCSCEYQLPTTPYVAVHYEKVGGPEQVRQMGNSCLRAGLFSSVLCMH